MQIFKGKECIKLYQVPIKSTAVFKGLSFIPDRRLKHTQKKTGCYLWKRQRRLQ